MEIIPGAFLSPFLILPFSSVGTDCALLGPVAHLLADSRPAGVAGDAHCVRKECRRGHEAADMNGVQGSQDQGKKKDQGEKEDQGEEGSEGGQKNY